MYSDFEYDQAERRTIAVMKASFLQEREEILQELENLQRRYDNVYEALAEFIGAQQADQIAERGREWIL